MPQRKNPTAKGRALVESLDGTSSEAFSLSAYRAQRLIAMFSIRPELAAMVAAVAFGGGAA